jgi:hypothetical protein
LALFVSPGKDLEQLFSNSDRLAFVADLLFPLKKGQSQDTRSDLRG